MLSTLSRRELEVLRLLSEDLTTTEVADALGISQATVATHCQHIYAKLGVRSRSGAIRILLSSDAVNH